MRGLMPPILGSLRMERLEPRPKPTQAALHPGLGTGSLAQLAEIYGRRLNNCQHSGSTYMYIHIDIYIYMYIQLE